MLPTDTDYFLRIGEPRFSHPYDVEGLAFINGGRGIAISGGDQTAIWNIESGVVEKTVPGGGNLFFLKDDSFVIHGPVISDFVYGEIFLRDTATGAEKWKISHCTCMAVSPDGTIVATGTYQDIEIWSALDGTQLQVIGGAHEGMVEAIVFSRDGKFFATGGVHTGGTKDVHVWTVDDFTRVNSLHVDDSRVDALTFFPDGSALIIGSNSLFVWNLTTKEVEKHNVSGSSSASIQSIAISPDGTQLLAGRQDGTIRVWETKTWTQQFEYKAGQSHDWVKAVAFSPDGKLIAGGGLSARVALIETEGGVVRNPMNGHIGTVLGLEIMGNTLFSVATDGSARFWFMDSGKEFKRIEGRKSSLALFTQGNTLAIGSRSGDIEIYDLRTMESAAVLSGHTDTVNSMAWSADGSTLISGSWDKTIKIWNMDSNTATLTINALGEESESDGDFGVIAVAYDRERKTIASIGSFGDAVSLWNAESGEPMESLSDGYSFPPTGLAISSERGLIASCSQEDDLIVVCEIDAPNNVIAAFEHAANVVKFSSDGRLLLSGGSDGSVCVWDLTQGERVAHWKTGNKQIFAVSFLPNDQGVLAGTEHGLILGLNFSRQDAGALNI